ncbi:20393_t:CDS:2, partial [Gigaspora rosea]
IINKELMVSENENKIKQLMINYESMENEYTSELEVSKKMKTLLKEEVELLTKILKSYEENQQYCSNKLRIERIQVIEYLLRRYKKELEQTQSNHNQKLEDKYNCSKVNPNTIKSLKCIEELQELIYGLEDQNYKLLKKTMFNEPKNTKSDEIFLKVVIDELKNGNGSLQKNEAILKDTIFA